MQLACPLFPDDSISHAVFRSVLTENVGRKLAHANLPAKHAQELVRLANNCGVSPPPIAPPHYKIPIEAGLFGDRIALQRWQREARLASGVPNPRVMNRPRRGALYIPSNSLRLPRALPLEHAADLYFNFSQPIGVGPIKHGLVPLSYLGPSGTSIVALSNCQCSLVSIVARLQSGNSALRRYPWRQRNAQQPAPGSGSGIDGADDEFSDADTDSAASSDSADTDQPLADDAATDSGFSSTSSSDENNPQRNLKRHNPKKYINNSRSTPTSTRRNSAPGLLQSDHIRAAILPCRLCKRGNEHPSHIFFECSANRLLPMQRDLIANARLMWGRLLDKIDAAVLSEYQDTMPEISDARIAIETVYRADHAYELEARWLTYRLLWAIPWPADAVPQDSTAARALGKVFDATILSRHASRPLADTWVMWSVKWTKTFGETWGDLIRLAGV